MNTPATQHAPPLPLGLHTQPGTIADLRKLAPWHYLAGSPAIVDRVLVIVSMIDGVVAVLASSLPVLNASWRAAVWPELLEHADPKLRAQALRENLRTIARVIVDPRYRGLGLATHLVRSYLVTSAHRCVEAPAALGRWSPFFERAGMTRVIIPASRADQRLQTQLASLGVTPRSLLQDSHRASRTHAAKLQRLLHSWADASRATRAIKNDDLRALMRLVVRRLIAERCVFVWTRDGAPDQNAPAIPINPNRHARRTYDTAPGVLP